MEPNLVFFPYESELEFDDTYNLYPLGLPHSKIAAKMYQDSVRAIRSNAVTDNIMNELLENRRNEDYYNWIDNKVSKYTACSNVIANEIANLYKRDDLDFEDWHYLLLYKKFSRILTERGHCSEETITSLIYNLVNLIRNDLNLRNLLILSSDDYVEVLLTRFVEMAMNEKIYDYEYSRPHMDENKMKAIRKHLQRTTKAASKAHSVSKLWGWMDQDQVIPPPTPISAPSRLNPENYYVYGRQMKATGTGETIGINIRDGCIPVPRVVFPQVDINASAKTTNPTNQTSVPEPKSTSQDAKDKKNSKRYGPRGPYKRTVIRMRMREISRKRRIFLNNDDPNQSTEEETDYQIDSSKEESEVKEDNNQENEKEDRDKEKENKDKEDIQNKETKDKDTENIAILGAKMPNKRSQICTRNTKLRSTRPISVELGSIKDLMVVTENKEDNKDKDKEKEVDYDNKEKETKENEKNEETENEKQNKNKNKIEEANHINGVRTADIGAFTEELSENRDKRVNEIVGSVKTELPSQSLDMYGRPINYLPENLSINGDRSLNIGVDSSLSINGDRSLSVNDDRSLSIGGDRSLNINDDSVNYQNRINLKREPMFDRDLACPIELNRLETTVDNRYDPYPGYNSNYLNHLAESEIQKSILGSHIIDHSTRTPKILTSSPKKDFETMSDLYRQFNMDYNSTLKSNLSSDPTSDEFSSPNLIIGMNANMRGMQESNMEMGMFDDVLECNLVYYKGDEDIVGFELDEPECEVSPLKRLKTSDPFHSKPVPDNINGRRSTRLNNINKNKNNNKENKENEEEDNENKNKKEQEKENKNKETKEKDKRRKEEKRKGDDTIWDMVQKHQKSGSGGGFSVSKPMSNSSREVPEDKDDMSLLIREHYHVSENVPSSQTQPYVDAYKTPKSIKWSYTDTKRFYNAIETFGTDLLLVRAYLPEYTDRQVYDKFKLEERKNPQLMQNALQTHKSISLKQYEQKHGKIDTNTHYNPLKDPLLQEETQTSKNSLKLNMNSSNGMSTESHQKVDDKIINLFM